MSDADKPLCFVLMPFGKKKDPTGRPDIDFNRVYEEAIEPAIEAAGLKAVRADREKTGGVIHTAMFERLMLCEYAIADLTTANANVFYELGVRHTARPATTLSIFAKHQPIPFDVNLMRALPYKLGKNNGFGAKKANALKSALTLRLDELRKLAVDREPIDSPIFELVGAWRPKIPARMKTDLFREQVDWAESQQRAMADARAARGGEGLALLAKIEGDIRARDIEKASILVDLMLSYRALKGWNEMIALHDKMPDVLRRQILVREQLAFAYNRRAGDTEDEQERAVNRSRALEILEGVVAQQGPSSETCGLIGRIHKDNWDEAKNAGASDREKRALLKKAVAAYKEGFEADPSDHYPGINAVTLLDILGTSEALNERDALVPVVRFAAERSLRGRTPDYWDHATLLELAVLAGNKEEGDERLDEAVGSIREDWEPETTARNLGLIREARAERGDDVDWLDEVLQAFADVIAQREARST